MSMLRQEVSHSDTAGPRSCATLGGGWLGPYVLLCVCLLAVPGCRWFQLDLPKPPVLNRLLRTRDGRPVELYNGGGVSRGSFELVWALDDRDRVRVVAFFFLRGSEQSSWSEFKRLLRIRCTGPRAARGVYRSGTKVPLGREVQVWCVSPEGGAAQVPISEDHLDWLLAWIASPPEGQAMADNDQTTATATQTEQGGAGTGRKARSLLEYASDLEEFFDTVMVPAYLDLLARKRPEVDLAPLRRDFSPRSDSSKGEVGQ